MRSIFTLNVCVHLFLEVFQISLWSGGAILFILIVSPMLDKRYTSFWRYLLWIVFAVRLVLPIDISVPGQRIVVPVPGSAGTGLQEEGMKQNAFMADVILTWAAAIWAVGVVCMLLWQIVCYVRFVCKLNKSKRYFMSKENLLVYVSPMAASPMLIGIRKPQIILPSEEYNREQLAFILAHEYTHYRRKDLWVKLLLAAARTIHWFNPLIAAMEKKASRDMELLCDSSVVKGFTREERKQYSETLLACAAAGNGNHPVLCTSEFSRNIKNLKERFTNIFGGQGRKRGMLAGLLGIGGVLAASLFVVLDTPEMIQAESKNAAAIESDDRNEGEEVESWGYYLERNQVFGHNIIYVNNEAGGME